MAINDYIRSREKAVHSAAMKLSKQQEQAIISAYVKAGQDLTAKIAKNRGVVTRAMRQAYVIAINRTVTELIRQFSLENAVNPLQKEVDLIAKMLGPEAVAKLGFVGRVSNMVEGIAQASVNNIIRGGIYKDGVGLSPRIWKAANMAANDIQNVVAAAMARNTSAVELAKLLEEFVDPVKRKNWDLEKIKAILGDGYASWNNNLEYNALRLARTTLTHSATDAMKQSNRVNPFNKLVQWHSVHAPGRTCQVCISMDGNIYTLKELPYDHPNGLCYTTNYYEESMDSMVDELKEWVDGGDNPVLEEWWTGINKPFTDLENNGPSTFVKN